MILGAAALAATTAWTLEVVLAAAESALTTLGATMTRPVVRDESALAPWWTATGVPRSFTFAEVAATLTPVRQFALVPLAVVALAVRAHGQLRRHATWPAHTARAMGRSPL